MGKNKIKLSDEVLKTIQAERLEKIEDFKEYFEEQRKKDSQANKADWNNVMPTISKIEKLDDAFFYFSKETVEISYSTELLTFNYSIRFEDEHSKLFATINVTNTFISWALNNL